MGENEPDISEEEIARRRQIWRHSRERTRLVRTVTVTVLILISTAVGLGLTLGSEAGAPPTLYVGSIGVYCLVFVLGFYRRSLLRDVLDRIVLRQAADELSAAEKYVSAASDRESLDLLAVWTVTQKRLDYYHQIALTQSRRSFLLGQVASGLGFSLLLAGAGVALLSNDKTAQIVAGTLGAIGAALAAYIASTFGKSQEAASRQLRDYFAQPLQLSRALAAERLSTLLPENERSDVINLIVSGIFESGGDRPTSDGSKN